MRHELLKELTLSERLHRLTLAASRRTNAIQLREIPARRPVQLL